MANFQSAEGSDARKERIWKQRGALLKHLGHLKLNNCSKNKRANMKRAFKAPNHRKHVKRRKS
jgi:hypothetical protein